MLKKTGDADELLYISRPLKCCLPIRAAEHYIIMFKSSTKKVYQKQKGF